MLAAYDISRAMEWVSKPTKVICYTFGAPRIGNYAFAHTYDKMVPETWNIVNDQVQITGQFSKLTGIGSAHHFQARTRTSAMRVVHSGSSDC